MSENDNRADPGEIFEHEEQARQFTIKNVIQQLSSLKEDVTKIGENTKITSDLEIQAQDLKNKEHALKEREHDLKEKEAKNYWKARYAAMAIGGTYIICIVVFFIYFFVYEINDYPENITWHLTVAITAGGLLSMFGTVALVLKGVFKQEISSPLDSITPESLKTIAELIKTLKGGKD